MSGGKEAQLLGKWGERLVSEHLRNQGWCILETNYRCRVGELDIVARKDGFLAFVEVKLRKSSEYGLPREAVNAGKQQKLRMAAQLYLQENPTKLQPRFDVAEVYAAEGIRTKNPRITYIENAF